MRYPYLLSSLLFAFVLGGCQGPASETGSGSTGSATTGTESPKTPEVAQKEADKPVPPVPEELKTDAYHWFGLANDEPMKFELRNHLGTTSTGTQIVKLKSVENGKAVYAVERTNDLQVLGNEEWSLEPAGIYSISNSRAAGPVRDLQAISKLAPGATWPSESKIQLNGGGAQQSVEQRLSFRVVGEETVKTKAGDQKALLIKASGEMKVDGTPYRIDVSSWYVKDKGMVKNILKMHPPNKPKEIQEITIQETK